MTDPEQARAAQLRNIEARTGHDLATLRAAIAASGKDKHGEIRGWLIETYGLGYGDANGLAGHALAAGTASTDDNDPLANIYSDKKTHLRAIHDAVLDAIRPFGDVEVAPKKAYVAFRRNKQFAMLGPKNATTAELGINLREDVASDRIIAQKPGGMCLYAVALAGPEQVDAEIVAVLERSYAAAG